jgi:hypothetical protein
MPSITSTFNKHTTAQQAAEALSSYIAGKNGEGIAMFPRFGNWN